MLVSPGIEDGREDPRYKVRYDATEKQLTIIAANLTAQEELKILAADMCHGDIVVLSRSLGAMEAYLGGAVKRRRSDGSRFVIKMINRTIDQYELLRALKAIPTVMHGRDGYKEIVFLWAGEIPVDGWRTLVFGHI